MNKIEKLRKLFSYYKIDGYIIPKNDEFFSEYANKNQDRLYYISNFSGSAGTALILKKKTSHNKLIFGRPFSTDFKKWGCFE